MLVFLQYIKNFFEKIPFKEKIEIEAGKNLGMLYDAVCNLVYYRDKSIKESFVYEGIWYGSYAITEAESKINYFKKLWQAIQNKFGKEKVDLVNYVATEIDPNVPNENEEDSSVVYSSAGIEIRTSIDSLETEADRIHNK